MWHIGPGNIYDAAAQLGPVALLVMLIPSIIMYVVEAYGWKVTLGPLGKDIPFWRVLAIRTAGEVVNMTTPAGYVGGEPLKASLLRKHHVPMEEAFTSVIIAKTTMTIAEVLFILLGIALGVWLLGGNDSSGQTVAAALLSVGLLALGTAAFVFVQRQGLCTWLLESLRKIGLKIAYLEAREEQLRSLDRAILRFYRHKRPAFCASTGLFFLGWMAEALEVYVILYVSRWSCHGPLRHLHRRPLRLYQRRHLLHPRQPRRPRRREFASPQGLRLLRRHRHHLRTCSGGSVSWYGLGSGCYAWRC